MAGLDKYLESVYEVTKKNIIVISENSLVKNPQAGSFDLTYEEAAAAAESYYKGYSIHRLEVSGESYLLCIQSESFERIDSVGLISLGVVSALKEHAPDAEAVRRVLSGNIDNISLIELSDKYRDRVSGYIAVIDGCGELYDEAVEVLVNTANVKAYFSMGSRIFTVLGTDDVLETCNEVYKNIVSELFLECTIAVGGFCTELAELRQLYENCLEALLLKKVFKLKECVLLYEKMYGYRIASGLGERLKESIVQTVFTPEFKEMMNSELTTTIEEFFRSNLNLTDTAAKLYVHRNTLLYRLEKIYKATGYDLKKFEDSWLFKLAWLIYKERQR